MLLTRYLAEVSKGGYAGGMNYEELLKLLPYLVTFASLIVTAILGIANYQISRGQASLEKERFANDKAMVFGTRRSSFTRMCGRQLLRHMTATWLGSP
jgi:hypothetical protein